MIGAHYDHLGHTCRDLRAGDDICNGATDNAAGVAAVLALVRAFGYAPRHPCRSIIFVLLGPRGGRPARLHVLRAAPADPAREDCRVRQPRHPGREPPAEPAQPQLCHRCGDGRHALAANRAVGNRSRATRHPRGELRVRPGPQRLCQLHRRGIPTVFFSDATGPCYHTDSDDTAVVDYDKLDQQIAILRRVMNMLTATNVLPTFVSGTPAATYADAIVLRDAMDALQADVATFPPASAAKPRNVQNAAPPDRRCRPGRVRQHRYRHPALDRRHDRSAIFTQGPCDGFLATP